MGRSGGWVRVRKRKSGRLGALVWRKSEKGERLKGRSGDGAGGSGRTYSLMFLARRMELIQRERPRVTMKTEMFKKAKRPSEITRS